MLAWRLRSAVRPDATVGPDQIEPDLNPLPWPFSAGIGVLFGCFPGVLRARKNALRHA